MIAVSPMMRPMPSTMPLAMPGRIARQQHAPDRRGAGLAERVGGLAQRGGSCASASRVAPKTSGSASSDIIDAGREERLPGDAPFARAGRGTRGSPARRSSRPKIASTMLGTPAIISIADSTRARQPRRAPVLRQPCRERDADGRRDRDADRGHDAACPIDRVEEAAGLALVQRGRRGFDEQARAQVGDALRRA